MKKLICFIFGHDRKRVRSYKLSSKYLITKWECQHCGKLEGAMNGYKNKEALFTWDDSLVEWVKE